MNTLVKTLGLGIGKIPRSVLMGLQAVGVVLAIFENQVIQNALKAGELPSLTVSLAGVGVVLLIAGTAWGLGHEKRNTLKHANQMAAESRQAQSALQQKLAEWQAFHDACPVGFFMTDESGWLLHVNDRTKEICGFEDESALGEGWSDFLHPEDRDRVIEEWQQYTRDRTSYDSEHRFLRLDGSVRWVSLKARPVLHDGMLSGHVGTVEDITRRRATENALRQHTAEILEANQLTERQAHELSKQSAMLRIKAQELQAALDQAKAANSELSMLMGALNEHAIIAVTDERGMITRINERFCAISGYSEDELFGQNHRILNSGYHPPEFFKAMYKKIRQGEVWQGEIRNRSKDGNFYWVDTTIVPFKDIEGKINRFVAIRTDVTERKLAEERRQRYVSEVEEARDAIKGQAHQLEEARDAAQAANRAKSEFLAMMSHEIRTPMNGVMGMSALLSETPLSPLQREYTEAIQQSSESLLTIINDILDFSKIEAGKLDIEPVGLDLGTICEDVVELMAPRAYDKGLELLLRTMPNTPMQLIGDPGRIRQILLNLIGNALKFTQQGHVMVELDCLHDDGLHALIRVQVRDTGIGIPQDKIGLLFQKFSQADASTTRRFGGTGLGLAISRSLAELMGGTAGVRSVEGEGSSFWFTLRLQHDAEGKAASETSLTNRGPRLKGRRVLLIDDHALRAEITTNLLQQEGALCTTVQRAEQGYAALAEKSYDVALVDESICGLSEEANDPYTRLFETGVPIVLITAAQTASHEAALVQRGFTGCVNKPFRARTMQQILREITRRNTLQQDGFVTHLTIKSDAATAESQAEGQTSADAEAAPAPAEETFHGVRVLLAEDNVINQKVARKMLEKLGCSVEIVCNGVKAVEMLRTTDYAMVFMDCQMPEMDGFEATALLRREATAAAGDGEGGMRLTLPIIALTANAMESDRQACLSAGMNDFISKPLKLDDLRTMVQRWAGVDMDTNMGRAADEVVVGAVDSVVRHAAGHKTRAGEHNQP